jgi:NAD(P)H-flavin reductase
LAEAEALTYTRAVIKEIHLETPDTWTFSFELEDGRGPADFLPGQFNMLYVHGVGEIPISVASSKSERRLKHTIRAVGAVTKLFSKMNLGDVVGLRGPFGTHWPLDGCYGRTLFIVAGGCGLPPLRPVIVDAIGQPERFKAIKILYGARTPKDLIYTAEYMGWGKARGARVFVSVDKGEDDWPKSLEREGQPTCMTAVGVVTSLFRQVGDLPGDAMAFVCGPEIMMKFTVLELLKRGLPENNIMISLERNMNCGRGTCGHCQMGPLFICRDGPIFTYSQAKSYFAKEGV